MNVFVALALTVTVGLAAYVIGYAHGRRSGLAEAQAVAEIMAVEPRPLPRPSPSLLDESGRIRRE